MMPSLPALAVAVLLLSGSAGLAVVAAPHWVRPPEPVSGRAEAYLFQGDYTFLPPVLTDATGKHLPWAVSPDAAMAVQRLLPGGGAAPSTGATSKGNLFVLAFDDAYRSMDKGASWEKVHSFVTPNAPTTVDRYASIDPILWVDTVTDRVFILHVTPDWTTGLPLGGTWCADLQYSDDQGDTWQTTTLRGTSCDTPIFIDHPKLFTAPYGPKTVLRPDLNAYPNVVYLCNSKVSFGSWCATSYDGGLTWTHSAPARYAPTDNVPVAGASLSRCTGLNGQPAAFPDGTLAVPVCGRGPRGPMVALSENNGLTWVVREFTGGDGQTEIDPALTITPDGVAYVAFRDADESVQLVRSGDRFDTWDGPFRVSPADHALDAFTAIVSGDDGRVAIAYLGTTDDQSDPRDELLPPQQRPKAHPHNARFGTHWHLFVSTSFDAASESPTFITQQVTPVEDPVQIGCIAIQPNLNCPNLRDFITMTKDADGRFYVAFTDACTPRTGCTGDPDMEASQTNDQQVSVAVQDRGFSLYAEKGILPSLSLSPPEPLPE